MRSESPDLFLQLIGEWLRPERLRFWPAAFQAAISAAGDPTFPNLPALLAALEPALRRAPAEMQLDLEALLVALMSASRPKRRFWFAKYSSPRMTSPQLCSFGA